MHTIRNLSPHLEIKHIEKLDKGWSNDDKCILHVENKKYLLRLSNLDLKDFKIREYNLIKECFEAGRNLWKLHEMYVKQPEETWESKQKEKQARK